MPIIERNSKKNFDTFQNYEIQAKDRDQLKKFLFKSGIGTIIPWNGVAINNLKNLGIRIKLNNSDELFEKFLMLPMNNFISQPQVHYVISCIKKFYNYK